VLTAERLLEQKSFQLMPEVDGCCWNDIVRQLIPDPGGGNRNGAAIDSWQ